MKLPPQAWAQLPEAALLLTALDTADGATRMVGGAVRDALIGRATSDIDLATRLAPEAVMERARAAGLKAHPTGIEHGTVTVLADGRPFEVTTLRRDVSTDGRRATVAFTDDWREDAARRDFTINALYADPLTGEVHDYFGGSEDLAGRRVRFIGDPLRRIAEDHLRILRFFRFHARFGSAEPDADALAACTARANDLMALSRERVRDELLKLLAADDPLPAVRLMLERGIFAPVLPEATSADTLAALIAAEARFGQSDPLRRLAALLPPDAELLDQVGHRLRLSTADRKRLAASAQRTERLPDDPRALAYWQGADIARDLWLLAGRHPAALAALVDWKRPRPPLGGGDLIARGMAPGPAVAARLRAIEERWVTSGFSLSATELLRNG